MAFKVVSAYKVKGSLKALLWKLNYVKFVMILKIAVTKDSKMAAILSLTISVQGIMLSRIRICIINIGIDSKNN